MVLKKIQKFKPSNINNFQCQQKSTYLGLLIVQKKLISLELKFYFMWKGDSARPKSGCVLQKKNIWPGFNRQLAKIPVLFGEFENCGPNVKQNARAF
jgi:hypothetical protein